MRFDKLSKKKIYPHYPCKCCGVKMPIDAFTEVNGKIYFGRSIACLDKLDKELLDLFNRQKKQEEEARLTGKKFNPNSRLIQSRALRTCKCCGLELPSFLFNIRKSTSNEKLGYISYAIRSVCSSCRGKNERKTETGKIRAKKRKPQSRKNRNYDIKYALTIMKFVAKREGVKCDITLIQLAGLFSRKVSDLTGLALQKGKGTYNGDRAGLVQFGGDGIRGGDYTLGNLYMANYWENHLRDRLGLSIQDFKVWWVVEGQFLDREMLYKKYGIKAKGRK